jgi:hypothetical protein
MCCKLKFLMKLANVLDVELHELFPVVTHQGDPG